VVFCLEFSDVQRELDKLLAGEDDIRIILLVPGKDQQDEDSVLYLMGEKTVERPGKQALETVSQLTRAVESLGISADRCEHHNCPEAKLAEAIRGYERSTVGRTYWLVVNEVLPGNHSRLHIRYGGFPLTISAVEALETIKHILCSKDPLVTALDELLAEVGDDRELDETIATYLEELAEAGADQDQLVDYTAQQLTVENPTAAAEQIVGELIKLGLISPADSDDPFAEDGPTPGTVTQLIVPDEEEG